MVQTQTAVDARERWSYVHDTVGRVAVREKKVCCPPVVKSFIVLFTVTGLTKSGGSEERDIPPLAINPLAEWKMLWLWERREGRRTESMDDGP